MDEYARAAEEVLNEQRPELNDKWFDEAQAHQGNGACMPSGEGIARRDKSEARHQRLQILEIAVRCTQVGEDVLAVAARIESYLNGEAK